jgi:hypothetical protein
MSATNQPALSAQEQISMFVLDVLRHDDIEQLSSILKLMNNDGCIGWREFWPHDFAADEVIPVLEGHVRAGYVTAWREHDSTDELLPVTADKLDVRRDQEDLWFALTDKGRALWNQWDPPQSSTSTGE